MPYNSVSKYQITSNLPPIIHPPPPHLTLPISPPHQEPLPPIYQENPLPKPVTDQISPPIRWKTIILVGVIMFFAGTITGVSLMLYLY